MPDIDQSFGLGLQNLPTCHVALDGLGRQINANRRTDRLSVAALPNHLPLSRLSCDFPSGLTIYVAIDI